MTKGAASLLGAEGVAMIMLCVERRVSAHRQVKFEANVQFEKINFQNAHPLDTRRTPHPAYAGGGGGS